LPTETATATATPAPVETIQVMTYNILIGGGLCPEIEPYAAQQGFHPDRFTKILDIIKKASPDIVGIQEANCWDRGTPPVFQKVASQLGMTGFLARGSEDFRVVLLTRFKIVKAEDLRDLGIGNGALYAKLMTPKGQVVHVFVVHLIPQAPEYRVAELESLLPKMQPYLKSNTILMGDMNFSGIAAGPEQQKLTQAGWRLGTMGYYTIDQIWTTPLLKRSLSVLPFTHSKADPSDHVPIGAVIGIYPTQEEQ
jgi:endonuclease/exonuclease/phosphatase family metal-dependent hydrolase